MLLSGILAVFVRCLGRGNGTQIGVESAAMAELLGNSATYRVLIRRFVLKSGSNPAVPQKAFSFSQL